MEHPSTIVVLHQHIIYDLRFLLLGTSVSTFSSHPWRLEKINSLFVLLQTELIWCFLFELYLISGLCSIFQMIIKFKVWVIVMVYQPWMLPQHWDIFTNNNLIIIQQNHSYHYSAEWSATQTIWSSSKYLIYILTFYNVCYSCWAVYYVTFICKKCILKIVCESHQYQGLQIYYIF
jgi:hypothetical protein